MQSQESSESLTSKEKPPKVAQDRNQSADHLSTMLWKEMHSVMIACLLDGKSTEKDTSGKPPTFFTEKWDKEKASSAIKDLASPEYQTREQASLLLQKMGPQVIPQLQEALKSPDKEVQRRAEDAIAFIKEKAAQESRQKFLTQAKEIVPEYGKLLSSAGASMSDQIMKIADGSGEISLIGPSLIVGPPKGGVSKDMQTAFDRLMKKIDKCGVDSEAFKKVYGDLDKAVRANTASDEEHKQYIQLTWLKRASVEGRQYYASALSVSDQPKDRAKAIELLKDHLDRNKALKPDEDFTLTFVRAGADKDPNALKRFKEHGGTDELLEAARKTLAKTK